MLNKLKEIIRNFKGIFNKAKKALEKTEGITEEDYNLFKEKLKTISHGGSKFLLELEKAMEYQSCKKEIDKFKEKIKSMGKNLKIEKKIEDGKIGKNYSDYLTDNCKSHNRRPKN